MGRRKGKAGEVTFGNTENVDSDTEERRDETPQRAKHQASGMLPHLISGAHDSSNTKIRALGADDVI